MSVRADEVQLKIVVNGSGAKKELAALDQEAYNLRQSLKGMKKDSDEYVAASKRLTEVENRMGALRQQIGLTGLTLKQLNAELARLKAVHQHITPATKAFYESEAAIKKVQSRITEVKSGLGPFAQAWKNLSGEVKGIAVAFAGLAVMGIFTWMKGLITGAGDLEDQLANVRKATGMTAEEVKALNKEFGNINTRTATKDLRAIAVVGGQMGFAGKDILGFVRAMDMAAVALGDEFTGGAEEVAQVLGKLRNTLTDLKSSSVEKDLLHIANALNVLGATGMATGPVVADFANRIGGYGIQAGLTSAQVLGLSATLQELGVTTERGGTAVNKIIMKMFSNVEEFSKIAGMSIEDFQKMLNTDLFGAFSLVMKKSKEMGVNSVELNKIIQDLEVSGAGASEVFAKLGANTELLGKRVTQVGAVIKDTTSITEEFNIKNATLGATLDILSKDFNKLFTNTTVQDALKAMVLGVVKVVAVLRALPQFIRDNRAAIWLLVAAIVTFNGALIASRAAALADIAVKKVQEIWILRAEIAQAALNRTMKANPILMITSLVLGAIAAWKIFTSSTKEMREEQEKYNEKLKEGQALQANTKSIEERFATINNISKESLNILKNDIQQEIEAYQEKEAQMAVIIEKSGYYKRVKEWENEIAELKIGLRQDVFEKERVILDQYIKEEKEAADKQLKSETGMTLSLVEENIKRLKNFQETVDAKIAAIKTGGAAVTQLTEEEQKAINEAKKRLEDLRNKIAEIGHQLKLDRMGENQREIQLIRDKYASELKDAEGHIAETMRLEDLMKEEILAKIKEQDAKEDKLREDAKQKRIDAAEEIRLALLSTDNREIEDAKARWKKLIDLAIKNGLDTKALIVAQDIEIAAILEKQRVDAAIKQGKADDKELATWREKLEEINNIVSKYYGEISNIMNSLAEISQNNADAELQQFTQKTNKEKALLQNQLDHKLISQKTFDKKMAALEEEQHKKEVEIKTEQFKKQKNAAIIQALINTALAITSALTIMPPAGYILAALSAVAGAAQVAAIASQPIPEFGEGTILKGPKHSDASKGMPIVNPITGKIEAMVEGEEALIPADTTNANKDIIYQLLAAGGKRIKQPKINFDFEPSMQRINNFKGGSASLPSSTSGSAGFAYDDKEMKQLTRMMVKRLDSLENTLKNKKDFVEAEISIVGRKGLVKKQSDYEETRKLSGV